MSEVTTSILAEEPSVRVSQRLMKYRQPMVKPPHRMLWLTILAGVMIRVAVSEGAANDLNVTASESPVELTTTEVPPPREAVTDLFKAPLSAFKVQVPPSPQLSELGEDEVVGLPLGKAENNSDTSPTPPFSNLWFNAGQSLGSAANSLTGWLNSRLVPQTTSTSTTARPPEVIVRVQSHKPNKKPLITIDPKRKPQDNRISPVKEDTEGDDLDDDDDTDDEKEYDDDEEEQVDEEDSNSNRFSSNDNEEEDDNEEAEAEDEDEDEEEEEEKEPIKKRKEYKKKKPSRRQPPRNNRRGYDYEEEEDEEEYDNDYEDDEDYDYDLPNKHSGRQQTSQTFLNRLQQFAQFPYSSSNKQKNDVSSADRPGYRPVRIIQNGQVLQLVQDYPNKQQLNRRRRPSTGQNSFQLVPIRNNQLSNNVGQKQKRKKLKKPDTASQIVIPYPQGSPSPNGQKRPSQYITIPWSKLGLSNPQQDYSQNSQQAAPIIVNIPQHVLQQNSNRRRRPPQQSFQTAPSATPQRKRLRRPISNRLQNGQVVTRLTEQNIRDIFRVPEIPPSRQPQEEDPELSLGGKRKRPVLSNEMQSDEITTIRPATNAEPEPEVEEDEDESQSEEQPYIVVGDEDTGDEVLARHAMPNRFLHIGGMKPYVDVLNEGRYFLKSGRQMRMDVKKRPESKITSIKPKPSVTADKAIRSQDITTESSSETNTKAPPTIAILGSENTSSTASPLSK